MEAAHKADTKREEILDDAVYTMAEAAALCRISIKTFTWHRDNGHVEFVRYGRRAYRFKGSAIKALQAKLTQVNTPCPSTKRRARRSGTTTSKSEVSDFLAARERRMKERRSAMRSR